MYKRQATDQSTGTTSQTLTVLSPKEWSHRDPALYTLTTELLTDQQVVLERYRLELLKDMGVNGIRTAHNMPAKGMMDLCDELGFYVVPETFDMWERTG